MTGYFTAVLGNVKGEQLEVTVDGERVYLFDWDKEIGTKRRQRRPRRRAIPIKAGLHTVGVTFLATNDVPDTELNKSFLRTMNSPGSIPGTRSTRTSARSSSKGRSTASRRSDTPSRDKIFVCWPARAQPRKPRARARSSRRWPSRPSAARRPTPTSKR